MTVNHCRSAAAPGSVRIIAAAAGIHGADQHNVCRVTVDAAASHKPDHLLFQRLTQRFQRFSLKFRQLVQKWFMGSGILYNSQIPASCMGEFCSLEPEAEKTLQDAFERLELSVRGYYRTVRVARTIADLEHSKPIRRTHIVESLIYRGLDRKLWEL